MSKPADDITHAPLPYIVVLRAAVGDDGPVETFERRVVAYSLYEAMFTAVIEATGHAPDAMKYKIESIRPDLPAYVETLVNRLIERGKKL